MSRGRLQGLDIRRAGSVRLAMDADARRDQLFDDLITVLEEALDHASRADRDAMIPAIFSLCRTAETKARQLHNL